MDKPITPEMIAAWRTLQDFARAVKLERTPHSMDVKAAEAIDVLDNSDFMLPVEDAGLCTYQVGGGYHSPPEYCGLEFDGGAEYCPRHQAASDAADAQVAATEEGHATFEAHGKCTHCGHPRVPLTPEGLTMYHGDVKSMQGDCLGSMQKPAEA